MLRTLPFLLVLVGLLGCKKTDPSELLGTWVITQPSEQNLPQELRGTAAQIELDKNGRFTASRLPGFIFFPPEHPHLSGGAGTWSLIAREGHEQIRLDFASFTDDRNKRVPYTTYMDTSRGWSTRSIFYFVGDADQGLRVEFAKK